MVEESHLFDGRTLVLKDKRLEVNPNELRPPLSPALLLRLVRSERVGIFTALHDITGERGSVARKEDAKAEFTILDQRVSAPPASLLDGFRPPRACGAGEVDELPRCRAEGHLERVVVVDP